MPTIDLRELQELAAPSLDRWASISTDAPVDPESTRQAITAWKEIYAAVKEAISIPGLDCHGTYLFADLDPAKSVTPIVYVGIVDRGTRTLRMRMWEHLAKELTSLNIRVASLDEEAAFSEVKRMITTLLPNSAVICPLLSGPISILELATKEEWNGEEAQAGRDHRQAA